jgi:hypothetical protein
MTYPLIPNRHRSLSPTGHLEVHLAVDGATLGHVSNDPNFGLCVPFAKLAKL